MIWRQRRNLFAGIGVAALLTFLFWQQRSVDTEQHDRFITNLQLAKQLDTEIGRDVLRARFGLLGSYDPFVQKMKAIRKVQADLRNIPSFVSARERADIGRLLDLQAQSLDQKARLVEGLSLRMPCSKTPCITFLIW